jgi:acetyl esterase
VPAGFIICDSASPARPFYAAAAPERSHVRHGTEATIRVTDRAPDLHPEAKTILDRVDLPPTHALSVDGAREALRDLLVDDEPPDDDLTVRDLSIPGPEGPATPLAVRAYTPESAFDDARPVLVYFHGGGWVRGDLDTHDGLCRLLAEAADCVVCSVDYRRAPEHPFPTPVHDAYAATEWAAEYASIVGGDPARIAVGGDSAGGNLAAVVTLMARERDGPAIDHQVLLYPVTDYAFDTDSYEENASGYLLSRASMRWYWARYLDDEIDGANPYASPLRAPDLSGLPSATVVTAGYDPLRDEGAAYAERLRAAGVSVTHAEYPGMVHVFASFPTLDRARDARATIADDLAAAFDGDGSRR